MMATSNKFDTRKHIVLKSVDLSRKQEIDAKVLNLVNLINQSQDYVTTSSCSGRTILVDGQFEDDGGKVKKKGCTWLHVTHEEVFSRDLASSLKEHQGDAVLKFEPFILHVSCRNLENARFMHKIALDAGLRQSGITVGRKNITLAIRSALSLEIPLSEAGNLLVSHEYLDYIAKCANRKMVENDRRILLFQTLLEKGFRDEENLENKMAESE